MNIPCVPPGNLFQRSRRIRGNHIPFGIDPYEDPPVGWVFLRDEDGALVTDPEDGSLIIVPEE